MVHMPQNLRPKPPSQFLNPQGGIGAAQPGGSAQELQALRDQIRQAEGLRKGTPKGRRVGARQTFVAAHPLEHLASALGDAQVNKKVKGLQKTRREMAEKQRLLEVEVKRKAEETRVGERTEDIGIDESQFGRTLEATRLNREQIEAGKRDTRERAQRTEDYRTERDLIKDDQWAKSEAGKTERALATAEAARLKGEQKPKPGARALMDYTNRNAQMHSIRDMDTAIAGFTKEQNAEFDSPWYEIGSGMTPDVIKRRLDEGHYSPEVDEVMRQGQSMESQIRRMFAGTAVTKYEGQDTEKWSPMAPGLSADQRKRRFGVIKDDFMRVQDAFSDTHGEAYRVKSSPVYEKPAEDRPTSGKTAGGATFTIEY